MSSAFTQPGEPTGNRLGAGGNLPRRLDIAAHEGGLGGGEIRTRKVVLLAVRHGELAVGIRDSGSRFNAACRIDTASSRCARSLRSDQGLPQHDLDQRRVGRELDGLPQRRDRLRRLARFQQSLALELMEIRILWLRMNKGVDLCVGPRASEKR